MEIKNYKQTLYSTLSISFISIFAFLLVGFVTLEISFMQIRKLMVRKFPSH